MREEADETLFWTVFLGEAGTVPAGDPTLKSLTAEAQELARIFAAAYRTSAPRRCRS